MQVMYINLNLLNFLSCFEINSILVIFAFPFLENFQYCYFINLIQLVWEAQNKQNYQDFEYDYSILSIFQVKLNPWLANPKPHFYQFLVRLDFPNVLIKFHK